MLGKKIPSTPSAPAITALRSLPAPVTAALAAASAALSRRADLERLAAEAAAAEPAAREAAARARAAVDAVETDIALVDDDPGNLTTLNAQLAKARASATDADEALVLLQRRQRGTAARLAEVDSAIEAAAAPLAEALAPFRAQLLFALHQDLRDAAALLADAMRAGHAVLAAMALSGAAQANLAAVTVPDVMAQPGRPRPSLIDRSRAWVVDDVDLAGEVLTTAWRDDPALRGLHQLLKPVGDAERQIAAHRRRIADAAERARLAAPPPPRLRPKAPPDPTLDMSDEEYRAHKIAEINAARVYPKPGPNPSYSAGSRPAPRA